MRARESCLLLKGFLPGLAEFSKQWNVRLRTVRGDDALAAKAGSECLRKLRSIGDDCFAKANLFKSQLSMDLSDVRSADDLNRRQLVATQFIEATDLLANFLRDRDQHYRDELVQAGVSTGGITVAMDNFQSTGDNREAQELSHKLVQAHLDSLEFLKTNYGRWTYTSSSKLVRFQSAALTRGYATLRARVTQAMQELSRLQAVPRAGAASRVNQPRPASPR